jgi:hypothetical protein
LDEPTGIWRVSLYKENIFFQRGDDFSPDGMNAFFRASESAKPAEKLWKRGVYVIRVSTPPVTGFMPGLNRLSLSC